MCSLAQNAVSAVYDLPIRFLSRAEHSHGPFDPLSHYDSYYAILWRLV